MVDRVGQQLGNYHLLRLLGRGGFADVYLGEHQHLGTSAAVKVLHIQLEKAPLETFRAEARTIAKLEHPHIVRVVDFGIEDDFPFLVMDYAPDGTLRRRHPLGSQLATETVVAYVADIAGALQYAHDQKIVHRDVKPENMLIGKHGTILLSDFGIAIPSHRTHSLSLQQEAGTVPYMAPEQSQGKARTASDQYSLGVVVYEWLSGDLPFDGTSAVEIAMKHVSEQAEPLDEKVRDVSSKVSRVVMKTLAKNPQERFACVQDFAKALKEAHEATSRRVLTRPPIVAHVDEVTLPDQDALKAVTQEEYDEPEESLQVPVARTVEVKSTKPTRSIASDEVDDAEHDEAVAPEATLAIPARKRTRSPLEPPYREEDALQRSPANKFRHRGLILSIAAGVLLAVLVVAAWQPMASFAKSRYDDVLYGIPRTYQTDEVVGNGDSPDHPSHFMAINLNRQVIVLEFIGGNPAKSVSYVAPYHIEGDGGDLVLVTVAFRDVTGHHNGKLDMVITVHLPQSQVFVFVNDGNKFRPSNSNDKIHL